MISRANFVCEKLKIYIRKERLFNQVRFIFYENEVWKDDSEIIAKPENHELLIEMHASIKYTSAEALRDCGYYVVDTFDYDNDILPLGEMFTDEIAFHTKFLQWKSNNS